MVSNLKEMFEFLVFISLIVIVLSVVHFFTEGLFESKVCSEKASMQELTYDYGFFQGCMIKKGDKWVDYEIYKRGENNYGKSN